jgi:putative membrane protein
MPNKYFLPLAATLALLNAVASVAQPANNDPATSTSATSTSTSTTGVTATSATASARALGEPDTTFLRKAVEGDQKEIASAQAALTSAQRSETREAARMILDDHRASSQKLQQLANRKGWTLPTPASTAESDQARATSAAATGAGFDDRFVAEQVKMHREAISLYRAQAAGGADPDLRQFAKEQLPHLEHHLEMLQGDAKGK